MKPYGTPVTGDSTVVHGLDGPRNHGESEAGTSAGWITHLMPAITATPRLIRPLLREPERTPIPMGPMAIGEHGHHRNGQ